MYVLHIDVTDRKYPIYIQEEFFPIWESRFKNIFKAKIAVITVIFKRNMWGSDRKSLQEAGFDQNSSIEAGRKANP